MIIKVTVELEEGVKSVRKTRITGESMLIALRDDKLPDTLIKQVSEAAETGIKDILSYFKKGGNLIYTYNQLVKDGNELWIENEKRTYMRCARAIRDVNRDIPECLEQAKIPMTREEIEVRDRNWNS